MTEKTKIKPIKAVLDIRSVPAAYYALPDDGRKRVALCRLRRSVANHIATYANPDGSSIRVSADTVAAELGTSRKTVHRVFNDLIKLGFMVNGGIHGLTKTRIRSLDIRTMASRGSDSPKDEGQTPPSGGSDSKHESQIDHSRGSNTMGSLPSSLPSIKPSIPTERAPVTDSHLRQVAKEVGAIVDRPEARSREVLSEYERLLKEGWSDSELRSAVVNLVQHWEDLKYTKGRPTAKAYLLDLLEGEVDKVRRSRSKSEAEFAQAHSLPAMPLESCQNLDGDEDDGIEVDF